MQIYRDIAGKIERPSTRASVPAKPYEYFGRFGTVRYTRKGRWSEITTDVVQPRGEKSPACVVIGLHNSEEPCVFSCATMEIQQARDLRALLDRAILSVEPAESKSPESADRLAA